MPGECQQGLADFEVALEAFRTFDEPQIHLVLGRADVRHQVCLKTFWIVNQIARVDLEELRQQLAGRIGQVRPGAVLNLGEVGLADRPA